jgi:UDP-N-acetylglucosamine 2-epimerase (non-hydrolysing)
VILCVFGTTGELIKLAPVLVRLRDRGHPVTLATTGQQVTQIPSFLEQFGLPQPDVWLARGAGGRDLSTGRDIPGWASRAVWSFARRRARLGETLDRGPGRPLVLVHGDTMTTVLGTLMGKALGARVAHIEGGLRSGSLRSPFPEELNRRLTGRMADIHYAPGAWAASNLAGRGAVVDTGSNTVRDSLALVPEGLEPALAAPPSPFGIVSLHRFELLRSRALLAEAVAALASAADRVPLLFVDHPVTVAALDRFDLGAALAVPGIRRIPRLPFFDFVQLERRCAFVVTDSGGSQEECYYLDTPCLVHRRTTERREGLGETTVVSGLDRRRLASFLLHPEEHRRRAPLADASPAEVIVSDLVRRGFAASA